MTEQLLKLPEKPGTVIAVGDWWLIRLRPYEGAQSAWELLPLPSKELREKAERQGIKASYIYGDEWVLAEVEQEGGYLVISDPRDQPSGVHYWKPTHPVSAAPPEARPLWSGVGRPPIGSRVTLKDDPWDKHGEVVRVLVDGYADVRWDSEEKARLNIRTENIEPEKPGTK